MCIMYSSSRVPHTSLLLCGVGTVLVNFSMSCGVTVLHVTVNLQALHQQAAAEFWNVGGVPLTSIRKNGCLD